MSFYIITWLYASNIQAQARKGVIIQNVFFGDAKGEGENMANQMNLNLEAVYDSLAKQLILYYQLDEISSVQSQYFEYDFKRMKNFKILTEQNLQQIAGIGADFYFKIFIDVDAPEQSLLSRSVINSRVSLDIFVFDQNKQFIAQLKGKKVSPLITSSPERAENYLMGAEDFWYLYRHTLRKTFNK